MRIIEQFLNEFGLIVQKASVTVVPGAIANTKAFFEGLSKVTSGISEKQQTAIPAASPRQQIDVTQQGRPPQGGRRQ
jgi:hypothetical protein